MKKLQDIQHVFFDLDNTLWDFSGNSKRILRDIYEQYRLQEYGISEFDAFLTTYRHINEKLWADYALGLTVREQVRLNRFLHTLNEFGIDNSSLAMKLADYYIHHTKNQTDLLPYAKETLTYLFNKYQLHIITNGFNEVQFHKLKHSGIGEFFMTVTTAENANCLKPATEIFLYALSSAGADARHCVYIGDTQHIDAPGAIDAGMQFILFNPDKAQNPENYPEVTSLYELHQLL